MNTCQYPNCNSNDVKPYTYGIQYIYLCNQHSLDFKPLNKMETTTKTQHLKRVFTALFLALLIVLIAILGS